MVPFFLVRYKLIGPLKLSMTLGFCQIFGGFLSDLHIFIILLAHCYMRRCLYTKIVFFFSSYSLLAI